MEWAKCIDLRAGTVMVANGDSNEQWISTSRTYNRGVPSIASSRARVRIPLQALTPSTSARDSYLKTFDLSTDAHQSGDHLVFEAVVASVRYVIPALVLMRTLFVRAIWALDTMFRPHALDQICFLDFDSPEKELVMLHAWSTKAKSQKDGPWMPRFKWMLSHPSALRMAGSVHEYAKRGIIGLDMPCATVSAVLAGHFEGDAFYATKCSLISIEPDEPPYSGLSSPALIVANNNNFWKEEHRMRRQASKSEVPAHPDGTVDITDAEWRVLKTMVVRKSEHIYKLCPRLVLDGVLAKLSSGQAWRNLDYKVGDWRNASYLHQSLRSDGILADVMEVLEQARC